VILLGLEAAEVEAFDEEQPATATMPAAMRPVIMKSLLRRGVCFMSGRLH
jgi:hypothetical protein